MRYFIDTEFFERGPKYPIELISLGIVAEDGREFYVENSDVDLDGLSDWLKTNVVPHLLRSRAGNHFFDSKKEMVLPHRLIGQEILKFVGTDTVPEFWAYFADYDWVVFCQLFGSMITLPSHFPQFCMDLKQEMERLEVSKPLIEGCGPEHNALSDARWNKAFYEYLHHKAATTGKL